MDDRRRIELAEVSVAQFAIAGAVAGVEATIFLGLAAAAWEPVQALWESQPASLLLAPTAAAAAFGAILAGLYNLTARSFGGLEFQMRDVTDIPKARRKSSRHSSPRPELVAPTVAAPPADTVDAWYVMAAGERRGPYNIGQMGELIRNGTLEPQESVVRALLVKSTRRKVSEQTLAIADFPMLAGFVDARAQSLKRASRKAEVDAALAAEAAQPEEAS